MFDLFNHIKQFQLSFKINFSLRFNFITIIEWIYVLKFAIRVFMYASDTATYVCL